MFEVVVLVFERGGHSDECCDQVSVSCFTSFVRISTVLGIALLVAKAAWAFSRCWRMEPLSPKLVKVGLDRGSWRRRRALGSRLFFLPWHCLHLL